MEVEFGTIDEQTMSWKYWGNEREKRRYGQPILYK